jgi:hypothetical protein
MTANTHNVAAFADRLTTLAEAYKADVDAVIEDVKKADLDTPAVRRLAAWPRARNRKPSTTSTASLPARLTSQRPCQRAS